MGLRLYVRAFRGFSCRSAGFWKASLSPLDARNSFPRPVLTFAAKRRRASPLKLIGPVCLKDEGEGRRRGGGAKCEPKLENLLRDELSKKNRKFERRQSDVSLRRVIPRSRRGGNSRSIINQECDVSLARARARTRIIRVNLAANANSK